MKLAWKLLKTDWRSGELPLLVAALFLSVMVVISLTLLVGRLQIVLAGESNQFLAADRVLNSPRPVSVEWLKKANEFHLQQARHLSFQSMMYAHDAPQLVSVKAADNEYPLRGELRFRSHPGDRIQTTLKGPLAGEIWVESRLFSLLGVKIGDEVFIGDAPLRITAELVTEPDRGAGSLSMGPRVLMHWHDIEKTAVVGEGSRLSYNYLFAGSAGDINAYEKWLLPKLSDSEKWLDLENAQPTIAIALARAKNFFLLASSIVMILASIAIAMASARFSQRHTHQVAVLKTLGASSKTILHIYLSMLLMVLLVTYLLSAVAAFIAQEMLVRQVASSLQVDVPANSLWPFVLGFAVASFSLLAFALPPIVALKNISAIRIFQSPSAPVAIISTKTVFLALLGLWVILLIYTQQWFFGTALLGSVVIIALLIALPAAFLLSRISGVRLQTSGWLTLARSNIQRRLKANALQAAIFAISLMLLVLIGGIKTTLFEQWQSQLPANTPNYFLVNVQEQEWKSIDKWLEENAIKTEHLYPMVRARLVAVNAKPVREFVSKEELSRAGADRELNLSWAETLPEDNSIVEGEWQPASVAKGVSIEKRLADRLKIHLGDKLTFMMAENTFIAEVTSIRTVQWDRMRPNFYMLLGESTLAAFPKTYMTSFWLPDQQQKKITLLLKQFPTVVVIDIDVMIKQIRQIIQHVAMALEIILVLVIVASILVMIATVQNSLAERMRENTIIRALGGTRKLIASGLVVEFAMIGLVAGMLASIGAECVMLLLQFKLFEMPAKLHPELWLIAPLMGCVIVGFAGFWSASRVLSVAPMQLLREV